MKDSVSRVQKIMTDVSTGNGAIRDFNEEYKTLWDGLDAFCSIEAVENPNPFPDLWEFYAYWKKNLPTYACRRVYISKMYRIFGLKKVEVGLEKKEESYEGYIDQGRLTALRANRSDNFDLSKLVKICEEINICYANSCFLGVIVLLRALLDHVPPVFGFKTFEQTYGGYGKKTFKEIAERLDKSARKIADKYLHDPIGKREALPNKTQVDFKNELDLLLAELLATPNLMEMSKVNQKEEVPKDV